MIFIRNAPDILRAVTRHKPRPAATAFSLIELMIVLGLIGMLAASVTVSIRGAQEGHALRTAADDLAGAIRFGFEENRITSTTHRVIFANGGSSYRVEIADSTGPQPYQPAPGMASMVKHLPAGVQIVTIKNSSGQEADIFNNASLTCINGPGGFDGVIQLRNRNGDTILLEILSGTGQVHVVK